MNVSAVRDVIARWESYRDRGIKPKHGWGSSDKPGDSCAMGDIAHYAGFREESFRREMYDKYGFWGGAMFSRELWAGEQLGLTVQQVNKLVSHNDAYNTWPVEQLRAMLPTDEDGYANTNWGRMCKLWDQKKSTSGRTSDEEPSMAATPPVPIEEDSWALPAPAQLVGTA